MLFLGIEHKPGLHLTADAAQRRRRQHAFGRPAYSEINIDASFIGIGSVDDASDVAVGY